MSVLWLLKYLHVYFPTFRISYFPHFYHCVISAKHIDSPL